MSCLSGLLSTEIFISTGEWGVQMPTITAENSHFLRSESQEAALVMCQYRYYVKTRFDSIITLLLSQMSTGWGIRMIRDNQVLVLTQRPSFQVCGLPLLIFIKCTATLLLPYCTSKSLYQYRVLIYISQYLL